MTHVEKVSDGSLLCTIAIAVPIVFWGIAAISATLGMTRAIRPRPERARALAARIVRELGGRMEAGERGEWTATFERGALAVKARVASNGFGDVVVAEVRAPAQWVPAPVVISMPKHTKGSALDAPINLTREGKDRRWCVVPDAARATLAPALVDWLFDGAPATITELDSTSARAILRRDDANDEAHVAEIRSALDALGKLADTLAGRIELPN